jgi:hypothetical protein
MMRNRDTIEIINGAIMPSAILQENMKLLSDASGGVKPEDAPLWNISNAPLTFSDALQSEFVHINARLTYIEQQLNRLLPSSYQTADLADMTGDLM